MSYRIESIDCNGLTPVRIYPSPYIPKGRSKPLKKTTPEQKVKNENAAYDVFETLITDNFFIDDYCMTITFNQDVADTARKKILGKAIRKIRKLYKAQGFDKLVYVYVVGRGDNDNEIHYHILLKKLPCRYFVEYFVSNLNFPNTVFSVRTIKGEYSRRNPAETMKSCVNYLWQHYESLEEQDKETYKSRYYPCKGGLRRKYKDKANVKDGYTVKKTIDRAIQNGNVEECIQRLFPDYRYYCDGFGHSRRFRYIDDYGQTYYKFTLIRKGSPYDYGDYPYKVNPCVYEDKSFKAAEEDNKPVIYYSDNSSATPRYNDFMESILAGAFVPEDDYDDWFNFEEEMIFNEEYYY